jgi:hypothetical protein
MLVKFEQVDGQEIWINPDHVLVVRRLTEYMNGEAVSACKTVIMVSGVGITVPNPPEEVVAKLFPQTRMPGEKFYVPV